MSANLDAATAADAFLLANLGLAIVVHFHFTGTGTATHAEIFNGATKACHFMTLKVSQRNHDIRIHNRTANLCFLY